jgi:predicted nucleotidyltransferase
MSADAKTTDRASIALRERVLRILRRHESELRAHGVMRLRLFGSVARGEAGPGSDVDLIAEIDAEADFSLIDHVRLEYRLAELLGRPVEISTAPRKMRPRVRQHIDADAVEVL